MLEVPKQEDESAYQVELIVGKTVKLDKGNRYFFGGKIERETIKGWGFPRYMVSKLGPMAGTLMRVDPNAPKVDRFTARFAVLAHRGRACHPGAGKRAASCRAGSSSTSMPMPASAALP